MDSPFVFEICTNAAGLAGNIFAFLLFDSPIGPSVNSIGAAFQLTYALIFLAYADKAKKVKTSGLLLAVLGVFGIVVLISLRLFDHPAGQMFVGWLSIASLIFMFTSPLFSINLVIRTGSVEFMPFYLSLAIFLMSVSFFAYGLFNSDPFIYFPNGIGSILGVIQLALYCYYHLTSTSSDRPTEPLLG